MSKKILIVDDNANMRALVRDYLIAENFQVVTATDGRAALFVARHEKPDLILLDIMMPEMTGYEFIRVYRQESETPIILLTAKLEESDKVLGLELGADDYVTKPFGMRELVARIRARLRHSARANQEQILRAADITLDKAAHTVMVGARNVHLTPSEFEILALLMSAPGHVFSRAVLLEKLQGIAFESIERSVDVHVRNLRVKIEPDPKNPQYIETVFGVGYRFCSESGD